MIKTMTIHCGDDTCSSCIVVGVIYHNLILGKSLKEFVERILCKPVTY